MYLAVIVTRDPSGLPCTGRTFPLQRRDSTGTVQSGDRTPLFRSGRNRRLEAKKKYLNFGTIL